MSKRRSPQAVTNKLVNDTYLLYQCGTTPPAVQNGGNLFEIPLTSVSVPDTVPYAFLVRARRQGPGSCASSLCRDAASTHSVAKLLC